MAEVLFAALIRLYPRSFRAAYGDSLLEMASARLQDARQRGTLASLILVLRESAGLVRNAVRERLRPGSSRQPEGPRFGSMFGPAVIRSSLRQFRRQPLYAAACMGTLALAVAAATVSIAIVKRAFLDPLPYADDGALLTLFTRTETWPEAPVSAHVLEDLRDADAPIEAFAPMDPLGASYSDGTTTQALNAIAVTPEYFETLGVRPVQGRIWSEGEADAVIVSWGFWQTTLAADPAVVGRHIIIDGVSRTVVGVMGREFVSPIFPTNAILVPLDVPQLLATTGRAGLPLSLIVRRADGATTEQVNAFLASFSSRLQREHGDLHARQAWHVVPLRDFFVGNARPALLGVGAAAALLLLIVGANIAGLSAARTLAERQQTAVQLALGATPARMLAGRLFDALILSVIGACAGIWLGWIGVSVLAGSQRQFLDRIPAVTLDVPTAAIAFSLGVLWSVVAAVIPFGAALAGPAASLTSARGATGGRGVTALRSGLVVLQVATALVLVVGAGLLVRTLRNLSETRLGYDPAGIFVMNVTMPAGRYAEPEVRIAFEREAVDRLSRIPGVTAATASTGVPVIGGGRAGVRVFGRTDEAARGEVAILSLAPDFIEDWRMRLVAGRGFTETDRAGGPGVLVINESAARRFWPEGDALGARVRVGPDVEENEWVTVIGIVEDIRQHGPTSNVLPTVFASTWQFPGTNRWFSVRTSNPPADLAEQMRAAIGEVDPGAAVGAALPSVHELISERMAGQYLVLMALGTYGLVAVVLCAFGVYAVVSLTSRMRRREYAIRMAIGAHRRTVRWLVLRQALVLAGLGITAGLAAAASGTRLLQGLLHGVAPIDAATFSAAATGVLALALVSAWWPARDAAGVSPSETLKE